MRAVTHTTLVRAFTNRGITNDALMDGVRGKFVTSANISALLLFVSYFASQSQGIKLGVCFFDVCCAN